jgi:hypothetical protein
MFGFNDNGPLCIIPVVLQLRVNRAPAACGTSYLRVSLSTLRFSWLVGKWYNAYGIWCFFVANMPREFGFAISQSYSTLRQSCKFVGSYILFFQLGGKV